MRISDWSSDVCSSDLPENIKNFDQEQLDQIYARLSAGPIPDGAFDGDLVFPKGSSGDHRLSEIVGSIGGMAVEWKTLKLEDLGRALWKGKVFYRDQRLLRNRIERSEEHTSELPSLMRLSYAVFCLKKKTNNNKPDTISTQV